MAISPDVREIPRRSSTRVCCEFDWQSRRFEIVELDGMLYADGARMFSADGVDLIGGVARFSIEGRHFVMRPKAAGCLGSADSARIHEVINSSRLADLLTSREMQIVELVSTGLRNKQIASKLQLSEYTVAAYVKQICHKLQVSNRTAMVSRCLQAGVQPACESATVA